MRIGLVSQEYPPETAKGGIGTQTYIKAHGLARRGHSVRVISRSVDSAMHEYQDGDVRVTRIPGAEQRLPPYHAEVDWLTYSMEVATTVQGMHIHEPFDLLEFPEWGGEAYLHLLNQSEWNRIPTLIQLHGPVVMLADTIGWPPKESGLYRVARHMEEESIRLADAVYSSSACSTRWCADHYGLNPRSVPTIHAGIETTLFTPKPDRRETRPTIVYVGRLASNKGTSVLIDAIRLVAQQTAPLRVLMIGSGTDAYVRQLKETVAKSGLSDVVEFSGFVPRDDLPSYLARAHIFTAPSRFEGGPVLANLEAMACGLPVVACAGSGAAEVVEDGANGFLVTPGSAEELAAALLKLLTRPKLREQIGARARQYVLEHAASDTCVERIEQFYFASVERCKKNVASR